MSKKNGKAEAPFKEAIRVESFTRNCRVELSEKELAERADRAAHLLQQRDGKEADRKAANTAAKSQIEELEAELRKLSGEVRDKATYRPVECERRFNYKVGHVVEKRLDTGEVLHQHAMTDAERQIPLDLQDTATEGEKLGAAAVGAPEGPALPTRKRGKPKQAKSKPRARAEATA